MSPRQITLCLWLLPVLFTALLGAMLAVSLPLWQVFNLDPDYYYLFNGLLVLEGLPPTDLGHPGTPVQVLIGAVLRLMHPFTPTEQIIDTVLHQPERHLLVATLVIYPFVTAALFVLGRAFHRATGSLWPALLAQATPFLSMIIPKFSLHPKPEPFLIVAACFLVAAALAVARAEKQGDRHALWLGVAMGFGIAIKLQFAVLGVVPLLLLDRRRLFLVYPMATIAAFFVFVAPALPSYEIFLDWWTRVLTHSGAYGTGEASVIDPGKFPRTVMKIFGSKIIFTITIIAMLVVLAAYVRMRRRGVMAANPLARLAVGMILAQVLTVIVVAKQSAAHYLIPALMLTGPTLAVLWHITAQATDPLWHRRAWQGVATLLVLLTIPASWSQTMELRQWTREAQDFDMDRYGTCAKIYFDAASAPSYAMQRGDMNAQGRYSPFLATWMPKDEYTWFTNDHSWWKNGLVWWNQKIALSEILQRHGGCAVFRGSQPWTLPHRVQKEIPGFAFDDTCKAGEEDVFTKGILCDGSPVQRR